MLREEGALFQASQSCMVHVAVLLVALYTVNATAVKKTNDVSAVVKLFLTWRHPFRQKYCHSHRFDRGVHPENPGAHRI